MKSSLLTLALVGAASAFGQTTDFTPPVSGLVFDSVAHSLRPVLGVPGAARLGPALASHLDLAAVAPDGSAALAVSDGKLLLLRGLGSGAAEPVVIKDYAPSRIVWAADASAAAVYYEGAALVETLLVGADSFEWHSTHPAAGKLTALAVAPQARKVAIATVEDENAIVAVLDPQAETRAVFPMRASAAVFAGGNLYLAAGPQVFASSGGQALEPLALELPENASIASLAIAGSRLVLIDAGSRSVLMYDVAARRLLNRTAVDLDVSTMTQLPGGRLLLATSRSSASEPLFVIDTGNEASLYFVPAGEIE